MFRRGEGKATAATFEVELAEGEPSDVVHLVPMGECVTNDGRDPWRLDDVAHANQVIEATRANLGARDFVFDYDHQGEAIARTGGTAPAAGWAKPENLYADENGIWARGVQWTRKAAAELADRHYRYISPWFGFEKKSRRLTRLLNATLTNRPAFELQAVAHQSHDGEDDDMTLTAIASALGLADDAGEDAILASITELQSSTSTTAIASALQLEEGADGEALATAAAEAQAARTALPAIAAAVGLDEGATGEEIATAAADLKTKAEGEPDPSKYVPIEVLAAANAKLASIDQKTGEQVVDAAIAAGKVPPANRDWALSAYEKDPEGFATAMGNQPSILKPGEELGGATEGGNVLSDEQRALCSQMGWNEEEYAAQLAADEGGE